MLEKILNNPNTPTETINVYIGMAKYLHAKMKIFNPNGDTLSHYLVKRMVESKSSTKEIKDFKNIFLELQKENITFDTKTRNAQTGITAFQWLLNNKPNDSEQNNCLPTTYSPKQWWDTVSFMVSLGPNHVDINSTNTQGDNLLHLLAKSTNNQSENIKSAIKAGVSPNTRNDNNNDNPLDAAIKEIASPDGQSQEALVALIRNASVLLKHTDFTSNTALKELSTYLKTIHEHAKKIKGSYELQGEIRTKALEFLKESLPENDPQTCIQVLEKAKNQNLFNMHRSTGFHFWRNTSTVNLIDKMIADYSNQLAMSNSTN